MGRLFWKFFFSFWLAQVVSVAMVGAVVLVMRGSDLQVPGISGGAPLPMHQPPADADRRPPPGPPPAPPPAPVMRLPLLPILAGTLVSLLFAALLAAYFARPIRSLRSAFVAVADGQLHVRIGSAMQQRHDELADLGQHFDHMTARLQAMIVSQRRLLHDVSHELRSPLARLQAAIELMQQQPQRGPELVERLQRDIGRMDALVGELLTLARLDAGMASRSAEQVDLAEVVADIVEDARFEAAAKGCAISLALTPPLLLEGQHEMLHRALENVVRNAVRHSPAAGEVRISGQCRAGRVLLAVADNGPGVAADELEPIFEPFFRSQPAVDGNGYGLGLAITRSVVNAHAGKVSASNGPLGGLIISIDLPAL